MLNPKYRQTAHRYSNSACVEGETLLLNCTFGADKRHKKWLENIGEDIITERDDLENPKRHWLLLKWSLT
jgi:hypothetical protein